MHEAGMFLIIALIVFLSPLVMSAFALARARHLQGRIDDLERAARSQERRLSDRIARLERPAPVEPAPAPKGGEPTPSITPERERAIVIRPDLLATVFTPKRVEAAPVATAPERVPLENMIGERILPRLGVVAIVLGLALLVWYSYTHLGPRGRLALAGGTGVAMIVGGEFLRRKPRLGVLGACLIGGGWAVAYITAYAAGFVQASQIIQSPLNGFLFLLAVSGAALAHALAYRNETIAGLAYLLTITTLIIKPQPGPYAWIALGLPAAVLVILAVRERWIRLCTLGAALLYIAEVIWLPASMPGSIVSSLAILVLLWAMWIVPDYLLRPKTDWDRRFQALLVAVNFGGVLVVASLIQQRFELVYMGWVWVTLGALYGIHAIFGRAWTWRPAYLGALGFSAILLAIGADRLLEGLGPVFAWMAIPAALFAWGLWRKDEVPRLLAIAALAVTFLRFWTVDQHLPKAWTAGLSIAALLYAMAAIIAELKRRGKAGGIEGAIVVPLSHLGAIALGLVLWRHPPEHTGGALFALGGLALLGLGPLVRSRALLGQGTFFLTIAALFVVGENLTATGTYAGTSVRIASTAPVLLGWLGARLIYPASEPAAAKTRAFFATLLFAGFLALLHFELGAEATPAAWAVACGAWFLASRVARTDVEFALASAGAAATTLAFAIVPKLVMPWTAWEGPVPTGVLTIAILLAVHLLSREEKPGAIRSWSRDVVAAAMALVGFILLDREMSGTWLTGSWAILGLALAAYGFLVRDRISRWSSLIVLGICAGKVAIFDLARFEMPVKIATLITLGGVMVALSYVYARHHRRIVGYLAGKH